MLDFKEKRIIKRLLYSRLTIVVLSILLIFIINGVWGVYKKASVAHSNKSRAVKDLEELKKRQNSLIASIENLKTSNGVESEIRNKFGVVKKGEEVVVVVDGNTEKSVDNSKSTISPSGLWRKFLSFFKRN